MRAFTPLVLLLSASCASYQAQPLQNLPEIVAKMPTQRLSYEEAMVLLATHAPELRRAQAEYETAARLAGVKTPWPNPELELAPSLAYGHADKPGLGGRIGAMGSLSFTIPVNGRLGLQDEVNVANAEAMLIKARAAQRNLGFKFKRLWRQVALARDRVDLRQQLVTSVETGLELQQRAAAGGFSSHLDAGISALELGNLRREAIKAQVELAMLTGELAELSGLGADCFTSIAKIEMGTPILPSAAQLRDTVLVHNPELATMRADYEVAERQLRLEVALQYPDLKLGTSIDGMAGEHKTNYSLTLGLSLPIFDRNQQGIAMAESRRTQLRVQFESRVAEVLAQAETRRRTLPLTMQALELAKANLPQAETNRQDAAQGRKAGVMDLLRLLEIERSTRLAQLAVIEDQIEVAKIIGELEQAAGVSLAAQTH